MAVIGAPFRPWEQHERQKAAELYAKFKQPPSAMSRKQICEQIVKALPGRTFNAVSARLTEWGETFDGFNMRTARVRGNNRKWDDSRNSSEHRQSVAPTTFMKVPDDVLKDRDYRLDLNHSTLTAEFCGDPKPGYSALDRLLKERANGKDELRRVSTARIESLEDAIG